MVKKIEPSLKSIGEYLKIKENYFVIPEYQRAYSWGKEQCEKLFQDIEYFIENKDKEKNYFFGTIIIDCSIDGEFCLIDGQQRTTTFLLLFKALLLNLINTINNFKKSGESEGLYLGLTSRRNEILQILYKVSVEETYELLKDSNKLKGKNILLNRSINEVFPDDFKKIIEIAIYDELKDIRKTSKKSNFFNNFDFFYKIIEKKSESELNSLSRALLEDCQIIEIKSWDTNQAITMFNSLNSTGVPLNDADIISAKLYANLKDEKRMEFNKKWKELIEISRDLEKDKISDIVGILQQYMYIKRSLDKDYIKPKEDSPNEFIVDVTTPGLRKYFIDIKNSFLDKELELCDNLISIAKKWENIKDFTIIKILLKFNENLKLFFSSYLYRFQNDINEEELTLVGETFLKLFILFEISESQFSTPKFKTFLFKTNIKLVDKNIPDEEIVDDFRKHIIKNWDKDEVRNLLIEYTVNRHALVYVNEYLFAKSKGLTFNFDKNVTVEHIMPQSGRNNESITKDAQIENIDEFEKYLEKLGNKILLEENINKHIGNAWFRTKKSNSIKEKKGYLNSKYPIASTIVNYPRDSWTKYDIDKATEKVADRITNFIFS